MLATDTANSKSVFNARVGQSALSALAPHDRQMLVGRDIHGKPFAFVPIVCRLYDLPASLDLEEEWALIDIGDIPDIAADIGEYLESRGHDALHRRHTPGLALILSQACNLTCSYCLAKQGTFGLPVETVSEGRLRKQIEELFRAQPDIKFIKFFGGEPTLKFALIERICSFVTSELGFKEVGFALTTNGTLNARAHIPVWQEYHVSVSVSIDGPEHIHDSVRKSSSGKGSFSKAMKYCEDLSAASVGFAAVGVFDERHFQDGYSYLDTIRFLNAISPLTKVQFVEALGDAAEMVSANNANSTLDLSNVDSQIEEAVDAVFDGFAGTWMKPGESSWVYDNNIFRFISGVVSGQAIPYQHACTASNLTTLMPSGLALPCYTFSERPELHLGGPDQPRQLIEHKRRRFQKDHTWNHIALEGSPVPWYRGIVGDVCVADMMNNGGDRLESSPLYRRFQEKTSFRVLQNLASVVRDPRRFAGLQFALDQHRLMTGKW